MEAKFSLINQGGKESIIYLWVFDYRFDDKSRRFKYSTRKRIKPALWKKSNPEKEYDPAPKIIIKGSPEEKAGLLALDNYLNGLRNAVKAWDNQKLNSGKLSGGELKDYLEGLKTDDRKEEEEKITKESGFFQLWQQIIDNAETKGKSVTPGTRVSKAQSMTKVKSYSIDKKFKPTLENIDKDFYTKFTAYLKNDCGLKLNTVGKHIKELKAFLREADDDRGHQVSPSYLKKGFKVFREPSESTYLTIDEIKRILALDIKGPKAEHRDVFVMACFVGARHSDWHQIHPDNVEVHNGTELLRLKQQKTNDVIYVPIHPMVRTIWKKYDGNPPKIIARTKISAAIKAICKEAEEKAVEKGKTFLGKITLNGK